MECLNWRPCNQAKIATEIHNTPMLHDNTDLQIAHCEQVNTLLHERPNQHWNYSCALWRHRYEVFESTWPNSKLQSGESVLHTISTRNAHSDQVHRYVTANQEHHSTTNWTRLKLQSSNTSTSLINRERNEEFHGKHASFSCLQYSLCKRSNLGY